MLTSYHTPLSINSRRVWVALLEKNLPFEETVMGLGGDQLQPEFLSLNPFHHIPVLVDDGFTVIESFAILDYLEAKYPAHSLLPTTPEGTFAPWFEGLGLPMAEYPTLQAWTDRLIERPSWQTTQPTAKDLAAFRDRMQQRMAVQGQ